MWWTAIPYTLQFREFGSAALSAMLVVSVLFFSFYVVRAWLEIGSVGSLRRHWHLFYTDANKAAIGWLTTTTGAMIKNAAALWVLHAQIIGHKSVSAAVPLLYLVGTLMALWGMVCLMHALTRGSWYRGQWSVMIGGALVFGVVWTFVL